MNKSLQGRLLDKVIRKTVRVSKDSATKQLKDYSTDKSKYIIPRLLKFPRKVEENIYDDLQVFEMESLKTVDKKIMFIHGGGYIQTFSLFHWRFLIKLCRKTGCGFTAPNYPLLPKYTYKESYKKVINYYKEYIKDNDAKKIVLMGDSAGGGFCLSLLQQLRNQSLPLPGKVILLSPFVDVTGANEKMDKVDAMVESDATVILGKAWANGDDLKSWEISPLYGDFTALPDIEIYVGTLEVLYDECIEVYNRLKSAGNNVNIHIGNNMGHDYPMWPILEAKNAIKTIIDFISK